MLCRALLAAAVFTYVLCVLLLSGVQKEDLDASTLRKLRRHNVNIDGINDRHLQKQCLGKTDTVTLTTELANPTTEKTESPVTDSGSNGLQADDTTPLQKIFEYLEFLRKEEKNKALENKENTKASKLELEPLTKLLSSSSFRNITQNTNFDNPSTERPQHKKTAKQKENEKINSVNVNTGLENLMNMLRLNIGSMSDTIQQESTTVKMVTDVSISKDTKDIGYITKIVEEIISKRQLKEVNTTDLKTKLNTNETFRKINQISDTHKKNKTISLTNDFLSNCKLRDSYGNNLGGKGIIDNLQSQRSSGNEPDTHSNNDDYFICNRLKPKEQKLIPDLNDNPIINNILNELKKESQRFKLLDNESTLMVKKNNREKPSNNEGLNKIYEKPLKDQPKNIKSQSDVINITDAQNNGLEVSDDGSKNALKYLLQTQSKLFDQIFNQQKNLIKLCNTEKLVQGESKGLERLHSALNNQPNSGTFYERNGPMVTIDNYKEKLDNYPMQINDNRHKLKVEDENSKVISRAPQFYYKLTDNVINDGYKGWRLMASNTLNKEDKSIETKNNVWINTRMDEKLKTTNTGVEHDPNLGKEYKRPWFYAERSNNQPKPKISGNQQGIFFTPNGQIKQNTNIIEPRQENAYEKIWSPYFDKYYNNTSIIKTNGYDVRPKNQQLVLDSAYSPLGSLTDRKLLQELMDNSKIYPKIDGVYQKENKSPGATGDQFETEQPKQINQFQCQTSYNTRIECRSVAEHKSDWTYLKNDESKKLKGHNQDTQYFPNRLKTKQNSDTFPLRPRIQNSDNDPTSNRYKTNIYEDNLIRQNDTIESVQLPSFPPNVIKDIANSIKDYVLRDLKTTMATQTTTTIMPTSPTTQTTTTTSTAITTTSKYTTTPTAITTTSKYTTTETPLTTSTVSLLKIQDASKVLEKMMVMLEKMNTMKETVLKPDNLKDTEKVTTQKAKTERQEGPLKQTTVINEKYTKFKEGNRIPQYPQTLQQNLEIIEPYTPHVAQLQHNTKNRVPHDPGFIQNGPEHTDPYGSQADQKNEENRLQYYSHLSQRNPEYRGSYKPHLASQHNTESETPYIPKIVPDETEKPTPFLPQKVNVETANRLANDLQSLQNNPENHVSYDDTLQRNPEESMPNYLQLLQREQRSRTLYLPQFSTLQLKAENRYDTQNLQSNPQSRFPYDPENGTHVPGTVELKRDNRIQYLPLALQPKAENQNLYDLQPAKRNPENRVPYLPSPLQYMPYAADMNAGNHYPFDPQGQKTQNHKPYDPQPSPYNSKDRSYDYKVMNTYQHSNIKYETYLKEPKVPISQKEAKPAPSNNVITVQTNSGEISPLKIVLQKPFVQNIILTTKPPAIKHHIDGYNFKKAIKKVNGHQVEVKESDVINVKENKEYLPRHTHKDIQKANPKSRKTKREREVTQHYVPRDIQEIERFHEKLERSDAWPHGEENIEKRIQRPIVKNTNYDDTHFRNFLQTQQKVNDMLEKILASGKAKQMSSEII